jgi:hypothetical protein
VLLMVGAIGIGIAAPVLLFSPGRQHPRNGANILPHE